MTSNKKSVVIWDHADSPPIDRLVLLWKGYGGKPGQISILQYLENNSDHIRSEYLTYISDIGQLQVHGKRIVEHLEIERGFSLWWMSLLAEKSPAKSKVPLDCLRLLAVNHFLLDTNPQSLELVSGNKNLSQALKQLCASSQIMFTWTYTNPKSDPFTLKTLWRKIPHILQAPIFLMRQLYLRWPLHKALGTNWFNDENAMSFFSYYLNLDHDALNEGKFFSKYWKTLPETIRRSDKKFNWIHHFMFSKQIPDTQTAISLLGRFNADAENQGRHNFLDSFISLSAVFRVMISWSKTVIKSASFQSRLDEKITIHSKGWLWPLLREDWKSSVSGTTAIENILWIQLFDRALASLPKQKMGLYLCENQGWERALIHFWKKHGHGRLIAVAHSTVRYWDLRYFDDYAIWRDEDYLSQPKPDQIALNGPAAWQIYDGAKQPMNKMVEVEALRYLHLARTKPSNNCSNKISDLHKKILILGDVQRTTTNSMLKLFESISEFLKDGWQLTLKPHPANPVRSDNYPKLEFKITDAPLEELLPNFQVAVTSIYTSAALECYSSGLSVITVLDNDDFNFSPLRGMQGICFVSTAEELKLEVRKLNTASSFRSKEIFFWTDPELPRWERLLDLDSQHLITDNYA